MSEREGFGPDIQFTGADVEDMDGVTFARAEVDFLTLMLESSLMPLTWYCLPTFHDLAWAETLLGRGWRRYWIFNFALLL